MAERSKALDSKSGIRVGIMGSNPISCSPIYILNTFIFFIYIYMYSILLIIIQFLLYFIFILLAAAFVTLLERKVLGYIQRRKGPNVVGFCGILQPFADAFKLLLKEHIYMKDSDFYIFIFSPLFSFFCTLKLWFMIPFNESDYSILNVGGIFNILIIMSISVYGVIFAGWSSNSKYSFLGGLRSTAQMISYEVSYNIIILTILSMNQSMDVKELFKMQECVPFIYPLFPLWVIFVICGLAETNRAPFDLPEAEAELVAGYNVEYSSLPFALFFLSEYMNIVFTSILSTIFFYANFTGLEILEIILKEKINIIDLSSYYLFMGDLGFSLIVVAHVVLFIQVRSILPRYRYDQLIQLGWKYILPISLIFYILVNFIVLHIDRYVSLFVL